jgi:phage regulator Rha-like protein
MQEYSHSLVIIDQDIPLADSREIAAQLGVDHRSFFRLVTAYQEEIEEDFGIMRILIAKTTTDKRGRGRPSSYALLTEDQTYAYMAYTQNTEKARYCKRQLVKAFAEARQLVAQQQTMAIDTAVAALVNLAEAGKLDQLLCRLQQVRGLTGPATPRIPRKLPAPTSEDTAQWEAFFSAWHHVFGTTWIKMTQLITEIQGSNTSPLAKTLPPALQAAFVAAVEDRPYSLAIRLGKALEKRVGIGFGARQVRLEKREDRNTHSNRWRVC